MTIAEAEAAVKEIGENQWAALRYAPHCFPSLPPSVELDGSFSLEDLLRLALVLAALIGGNE